MTGLYIFSGICRVIVLFLLFYRGIFYEDKIFHSSAKFFLSAFMNVFLSFYNSTPVFGVGNVPGKFYFKVRTACASSRRVQGQRNFWE